MRTIHDHTAELLLENRRLGELTGRYQRNLRNNSSLDVLVTQARQIKRCESRISRLYKLIRTKRVH